MKELFEKEALDLKTMIVFRKADRSIRCLEQKAARDHGLTPSQFSVLDTLYAKGKMRIQDLTDRMLATSGNMTVIIRNMERDGLITRVCDPSDRRAFLIELTPMGREQIEAIYPEHIAHVKEALSVLTKEDKEDLIRILKKFKNLS